MDKLTIFSLLFLLVTSSTTAINTSVNTTPTGPYEFNIGKTSSIEFNTTFNSTKSVDNAYLETNEGFEKENYTRYTEDIIVGQNSTTIKYSWDNQFPVLDEKNVSIRPVITTDNQTFGFAKENTTNISVLINPNFRSFRAQNTFKEENAKLKSKVTHPVGRNEISRVEYTIQAPDEEYKYVARREDEITVQEEQGNVFEALFVETTEVGTYDVTATAITEEGNVTASDSFRVEEGEKPKPPKLKFTIFSIGDTALTQVGAEARSVNIIWQAALGLHIIVIATTSTVLLGGGGTDTAYYGDIENRREFANQTR